MLDHSEDIKKADQQERDRAFEGSQAGVGPPRPVRPDEGDSPQAEAQRLADQDPRMIEMAERQSEAERLGVTAPSAPPEVRRQTEAAEEAIDTDDEDGDHDLDEDVDQEEADDEEAEDAEEGEAVPSPTGAAPGTASLGDRAVAEQKARDRGLEIRDFGTSGDWRVFDPATGKMVSKLRLEEPVNTGSDAPVPASQDKARAGTA